MVLAPGVAGDVQSCARPIPMGVSPAGIGNAGGRRGRIGGRMIMPLHRLYAGQSMDAWVAEAAAPAPRAISEKLVRCLWFDRRWRPVTLQTLDGRQLMVRSPGRWNLHAGPDFQQAVLEFSDGGRCRGDVEIHRSASGWTAHRHHLDPRYNQVILHVVLWNDRQTTVVRRADGQAIPQVVLAPQLPRPLVAYLDDIVPDDYPQKYGLLPGQCYAVLRALPPASVQQFLAQAGAARLRQRMERWARRAATVGLAQVLYEAVFRALGAVGYRQHFQQLARVLAWQELQACVQDVAPAARQVTAEALLLGMAGILPQRHAPRTDIDQETQQYLTTLHTCWAHFPAHITRRAWHHVPWQQPHVRPTNTPERRLAGMAQLVTQYCHTTLLEAALLQCRTLTAAATWHTGRRLCNGLTRLFSLPATSYWAQHARLGGQVGRPQRLIGEQRALTMVVDAVLPVLLLYATQEQQALLQAHLWACYQAAPRLPDNHVLRYMARRLLGQDPALLTLVTGACQQQGMLQIFTDFCDNDEGECQGCDFPPLSELTGSTPDA